MRKLYLKTENEIGRDFYTFIKASCIAGEVSGEVYRNRRPEGSKLEDVVVTFRTANEELMQVGYVDCDIFIPDVYDEYGMLDADKMRAGEIESVVNQFERDFTCEDGYNIHKDDVPTLMPAEEVGQHFIHVRFRFERRAS